MPNKKNTISMHNKRTHSNDATATIPTSAKQPEKESNCGRKNECPLIGKCLQTNVIYKATVTLSTYTKSYGLATIFKERYKNHLTSLRFSRRWNETIIKARMDIERLKYKL